MKSWLKKTIFLVVLIASAPIAAGLQRLLSSINEGDGEITSFAINHMVTALPTLVAFLVVSLLLWWCRSYYTRENVILGLCYAVAFFGVLNFAAEVLLESAPAPESDDSVNRVAQPYIQFKGAPGKGSHNSLGYGGPAPDINKGAGEYRILVLGGSTVRFGNPSVSELLEEMFHKDGFTDVRAFNIGVSGSVTGMELARLVFEMSQYQPDLVVSYSGGNDINLPIMMDPRPGYPYNFMIYEHHPLYLDDYPTAALTAYGSHLFRLVGARYYQEKFSQRNTLAAEAGWNTATWRDQIAAAYFQNMLMTAKVSRALESDFVAFLQPMLFSKKTLSPRERAYLEGMSLRAGLEEADLLGYFNDVRDGIHRRIQSGGEQEFRFSDLTTVYDTTDTTIFPDFIHTGPDARRMVVEQMYETVRDIRNSNLQDPSLAQ